MGRPKLLMPLNGRPLIAHSIEAWRVGGVDRIVVVVRADDAPLAAAVESLQIPHLSLVRAPIPPPDMKSSVQAALRHIGERLSPAADDCFLAAPADMPGLSPPIIAQLVIEHTNRPGKIIIPTIAGRRGHPVLYPWPLAAAVFALETDEGLNALASRHPVQEIACDSLVSAGNLPFADIDTPEQYRALVAEYRDE